MKLNTFRDTELRTLKINLVSRSSNIRNLLPSFSFRSSLRDQIKKRKIIERGKRIYFLDSPLIMNVRSNIQFFR